MGGGGGVAMGVLTPTPIINHRGLLALPPLSHPATSKRGDMANKLLTTPGPGAPRKTAEQIQRGQGTPEEH